MVMFHNIKGKMLCYSDRGRGDVIVLLHGYLESMLVFESLTEELSRHFRVISIDLPGHGKSERFSDTHTMDELAVRIRSLLDNLSIEKILLVGHSLGGYVALAFLEKFPGMMAGYCLFHSHPFADTEEAIARRNREKTVIRAGKKHIMYPGNIMNMFSPHNVAKMSNEIARLNEIASLTPDEGIISILNGMIARPDRSTLCVEGIVPMLWILGIHDQYINYENATRDLKLPDNARLITLYESGHLGFLEEAEKAGDILTRFALRVFEK